MSRHPRDTPAGGVEPAPNPRPHPSASPATLGRNSPSSTLPKHPRKRRTSALASLAVAVGHSRRNTGADTNQATEPVAPPEASASASDLARTYALLHEPPTEEQAYEFAKLLRSG